MTQYSELIAKATIEDLLAGIKAHIEQQTVNKVIPTILSREFSIILGNNMSTMIFDAPIRRPLTEEVVSDVPCLNKDTLMPKELSRQSVIVDNNSSVNATLTSLGLKKRHQTSRINSLSLSSRPNALLLTERKLKATRVNKSQLGQDGKMESLEHLDSAQDPEIQRMRKKTEIRLQGEFQFKRMQLNHQKSFKQKLEAMSSLGLEDPLASITHDYDGEFMKSLIADDKIKIYSARPGIGAANKKIKEGDQTFLPPETSKVIKNKIIRQRQVSRQLKSMQIPLFPQSQSPTFIQPSFKSYRLSEYKKHFGNGYSRLDQVSKTIDYGPTKDLTDEIFEQKKHLNDSQQMSTLARSQLKNSQVSRRLALPRLHGRYNVLDRYSEL